MTEGFIQNVQFDLFEGFTQNVQFDLSEDFIQNIQFDLFSGELVIGETATLLLAENYVTIREVFVNGVKVEPNEEKQIFLYSGVTSHNQLTDKNAEPNFQHVTQEEKTDFHTHNNKEYLDGYNPTLFATALQGEKADSALQSLPLNTVVDADYSALKDKVNGIEPNANNYQHPFHHPTYMLEGVNPLVGNSDKYLNEKGDFTKPLNTHGGLEDKNEEAENQHVDTTITKETLVNDDKVTIYDSSTGKVVLTDKSNVSRYDAETVSAPANAGILTLKNATETVISTTLTNSNSFTIALPTEVAGKINESILIFKVGATLPTLTQPSGVVYRTETPTIAINQTWTFCYEKVTYDNGLTYETYVSTTKNV